MGNKKNEPKNRRQFFSSLLAGKPKGERVKMLTPDGKLVEVDKQILEQAQQKIKAGNKEIYNWMQNPSKDNV